MSSRQESILSFPYYQPSQEERLMSALDGTYERVLVDVGHGGRISLPIDSNELEVLIDPALSQPLPNQRINLHPQGRVVFVQARVEEMSHLLHRKADLVQIISPDPRVVTDIVYASLDMVKAFGLMVIALDLNSQLEFRSTNPSVSRQLIRIMKQSGFTVTNRDLEEVLGVMPKSQFKLEEAIVGVRRNF